MTHILNIDTALENGFVGLSLNDAVIACQSSADQKEHASFLQPAVRQLMYDAGKTMADIDAVAVAIGPGSYTGLRVGLASAKGFSYALQKPLIAINTLKIIALATLEAAVQQNINIENIIFCPMIDARRMEVFAAIFDSSLNMVEEPKAIILDENSFFNMLEKSKIIFSGNGMKKFNNICQHPNAIFIDAKHEVSHLAKLASAAYHEQHFADVAYLEPFYAKAFHSTQIIKD